jgi:hypothetical protein
MVHNALVYASLRDMAGKKQGKKFTPFLNAIPIPFGLAKKYVGSGRM